jgi:hypothetical protein
MKAIVQTCWQYFKLGTGSLLVFFAVAGLVGPKSEHLERYERLEGEGSVAIGKVTGKPTSQTKLPQSSLNTLGPAGKFASGFVSGNRAANALNGTSNQDPLTLQDHYVAYEFRTPEDVVVQYEVPISADEYDRLVVGAPIEVLYHPQNPQIHRLIDYSTPFEALTFEQELQGAFLGAMIGGLFIWRGWPAGGTGSSSPPARSTEQGRIQRIVASGGAPSESPSHGRMATSRAARSTRRTGFGQRT